MRNKKIILIGGVLFLIIIILIWNKSSLGNGGWVCEGDKWVAKGKPSKPRPLKSCIKTENEKNQEEQEKLENIEVETQAQIEESTPEIEEEPVIENDIKIDELVIDSVISSPLKITGQAKGWYFEGSFPVELIGENEEVLAQSVAKATGDWMVDEFVPFEVELNFDIKDLEKGNLIFRNDNPSDLPENSKELVLPVVFR